MNTEVFLFRHGETGYHADNRYCGSTDLELTANGRQQAERLGQWATGAQLAAVYSSRLRRAVDTAVAAAAAAGIAHHQDARLAELDFGQAEGLTAAEMRQRFPAARAAFESDPVAHPLPGGEDPLAAIARGVSAVESLVEENRGSRVLVVCHSTLLRLLTCHFTGRGASRYRRDFPRVSNTSGAVLRFDAQDQVSLVDFNPGL